MNEILYGDSSLYTYKFCVIPHVCYFKLLPHRMMSLPREWWCSVMNMMVLQKFSVTY